MIDRNPQTRLAEMLCSESGTDIRDGADGAPLGRKRLIHPKLPLHRVLLPRPEILWIPPKSDAFASVQWVSQGPGLAQATVPGVPPAPHALSQDEVVRLPQEDPRTPGPPMFSWALASAHREGTRRSRHTGSSPSHALEKGECQARAFVCPQAGALWGPD